MTTEVKRANLTDEQLLARAKKADWIWYENFTNGWPSFGKDYPFTGWLMTTYSAKSCPIKEKVNVLRGKFIMNSKFPLGFDHNIDCKKCSRPIFLGASYSDNDFIKLSLCFNCHYWTRLINYDRAIVVLRNGIPTHYCLGKATKPSRDNGFGGTTFYLQNLKTNEIIKTCDLWHQGEIPEIFWQDFPVTYRFVNKNGGELQ